VRSVVKLIIRRSNAGVIAVDLMLQFVVLEVLLTNNRRDLTIHAVKG